MSQNQNTQAPSPSIRSSKRKRAQVDYYEGDPDEEFREHESQSMDGEEYSLPKVRHGSQAKVLS